MCDLIFGCSFNLILVKVILVNRHFVGHQANQHCLFFSNIQNTIFEKNAYLYLNFMLEYLI